MPTALQIGISGCSHCVVSFMGQQTEFPILVCDQSTDAIIGTDTLGYSVNKSRMVCLRMVASRFNYTGLTLLFQAVFSPSATVRYHHTQRQCSIAPCGWWAAGPCSPADYWRDLHYLRSIKALWWAELLWIHPSGVFQLQPRYSYGRAVLRGWHGGTYISHTVCYGTSLSSFM